MRFRRSFNIAQKFAVEPWEVFEVVPLRDREGRILAYCETKYRETRDSLPLEVFNHEMRDRKLMGHDSEALAGFMSEFGLLGVDRSGRSHTVVEILNIGRDGTVSEVEGRYGFYERYASRDEVLLTCQEWYEDVRRALMERGFVPSADDSVLNPKDGSALGCAFATAEEVERSFDGFLGFADALAVLSRGADDREIAALLKGDGSGPSAPDWASGFSVESVDDLLEWFEWRNEFLNEKLCAFSPRITLECVDDDGSTRPFGFEGERVANAEAEAIGCLDLAIALQLYNFALDLDKCKKCDYCGKPFVEKRSKSRKGPARSTSSFCSDECLNRNKMKEYRLREKKKILRS